MRYFMTNLYFARAAAMASVDALCFAAALALSWTALGKPFEWMWLGAGIGVGVLVMFASLYLFDAYRLSLMRDASTSSRALGLALGLGGVLALGGSLALRLPQEALLAGAFAAALYVPLLVASRAVLLHLLGRTAQRVAVLGSQGMAQSVAAALEERARMGFRFVGFIAESPEELPVLRGLGHMDELEKLLERFSIDVLVVAFEAERSLPEAELLAAKLRGVRVAAGLSLYERLTGRVYLRALNARYLIFSQGFRMGRLAASLKRAIDVSAAALGLLLAAPVLGILAVLIPLDSPGPAFFRQQRVGRNGRTFSLVKLRSMVDRAEAESGPVWAGGRSDPRVTRIGRWIRRTRLDEIPQLWNVLLGDMSLVGPRPERPEFVQLLGREYPYFPLRETVRPGLTGWAQVCHGYVNDVAGAEDKLALDLFYLKYQSLTLDLWILWKTARTVIRLQGV